MIIIKASSNQRKGVALITCLVLMALSSVLLVSVVVQELSTRKKFEQINLETKVQNLAMSAQEIALGFILEDEVAKIPAMISPIRGSKVSLKVQETSKNSYMIEINAEFGIISNPDRYTSMDELLESDSDSDSNNSC